MTTRIALVFALMFLPRLAFAKPVTGEEAERQNVVIERLKGSIEAATTDVAKIAAVTQVLNRETDVDLRRRILEIATTIAGPASEMLLTTVLTTEEDAGLRIQAATALGRTGSEKSLGVLARVAATDRTTKIVMGCIQGESSARRAATFAIADLAERFPQLADKAAAELRALPIAAGVKDNESLADARAQSLYQITHDEALIYPFYKRLQSPDVKVREQGVVAFRFLKLKKAPPEIVKALEDPSPDIRSWTALVLGEIGDRATGPVLMAIAADTKEDAGPRCNAIGALGQMKLPAAADLMEKLLTDAQPAVPANAAIALFRITGKKVKEFPEGYRTD